MLNSLQNTAAHNSASHMKIDATVTVAVVFWVLVCGVKEKKTRRKITGLLSYYRIATEQILNRTRKDAVVAKCLKGDDIYLSLSQIIICERRWCVSRRH